MSAGEQSAVIALGANLGDRAKTLHAASARIEANIGPILSRSKLYETEPLTLPGVDAQFVPKYLNGVLLVNTVHAPEKLLEELLSIERELGRYREREQQRWESRVVDLDLIAIGSEIWNSSKLTLPHPRMHLRSFVLEPLAEILPEWRHPLLGKTVVELLQDLKSSTGESS